MKPIDFKTSGYFPNTVNLAAVLLSITGLYIFTVNVLAALILIAICMGIFTTHYRLSIDFDSKVYHDYLWILGVKNGEKENFERLEYLFIKKNKISQTMSLRANTTTIRKEVFDGYLKFSGENKVHLMTNDSKEVLINKLRFLSKKLGTRIIDYADGGAIEI